jgi:hypothetical protein
MKLRRVLKIALEVVFIILLVIGFSLFATDGVHLQSGLHLDKLFFAA